MKKLLILIPAMALTTIIHSDSINMSVGNMDRVKIERIDNINLKTETFKDLAEKIHNNKSIESFLHDNYEGEFLVQNFEVGDHLYNADSNMTLSQAGVHNKDWIHANLPPKIKEPIKEEAEEERSALLPVKATEPHRILGVPLLASKDEVIKAHRNLARMYHPDKLPAQYKNDPQYIHIANENMKKINAAKDELTREY